MSLEVAAERERLAGAAPPVRSAAPIPRWSIPPRPYIAVRGGPSLVETRCCCHNRRRPAPAGGTAPRPAADRATPAPTPAWCETASASAPVLGGSGRDPRSTPAAGTTPTPAEALGCSAQMHRH